MVATIVASYLFLKKSRPDSYPIDVRGKQAGVQAFLRVSGSCDARSDIYLKVSPMMRDGSSNIFAHMGSDVFGWVEFWRSRREMVNDETFLRCQEFLYHLAIMDGMVISDENDGTEGVVPENNGLVDGVETVVTRRFHGLYLYPRLKSAS